MTTRPNNLKTAMQEQAPGSDLERAFDNLLLACAPDLPKPEKEVELIPGRRFRCDRVWSKARVVVELEGGVWNAGRHSRGTGFNADCLKYNELAVMGYTVLRFTTTHIDKTPAYVADILRRAIAAGYGK